MSPGKAIILLLSTMTLITSCVSTKKQVDSNKRGKESAVDIEILESRIKKNNISRDGFIINRSRIELETEKFSGSFTLNAKVKEDGRFVASVRGPLGIEFVRAVCTGDTVFIINRIERSIGYGKKEDLMSRFGVPVFNISYVMGDMPEESRLTDGRIDLNGNIIARFFIDKYEINVLINREMEKIEQELITSQESVKTVQILYKDYKLGGDKRYPGEIVIEDNEKLFHVKIVIEDFKEKFNDEIELKLPDYRKYKL